MLIVSFPSIPDPVTEALCRAGPAGVGPWQVVPLRADLPLAANLAQLVERAQERAALVGVGAADGILYLVEGCDAQQRLVHDG